MTTPNYTIVPVTADHVAELARTIRPEDRTEVLASSGHSPIQALESSLAGSVEAWTGMADGEVLCLFGVNPISILNGVFSPWMLSSESLPRHFRAFLRVSRVVVATWRQNYPILVNYTDSRYSVAIRWLSWLGFTIHPVEHIGPERALFHKISIGV
ncbi:MAG: hypothetical protein MN733_16160 [Nitrososphaera sp.]|nr:hypothetical protein [Nitrososphaera sp.]